MNRLDDRATQHSLGARMSAVSKRTMAQRHEFRSRAKTRFGLDTVITLITVVLAFSLNPGDAEALGYWTSPDGTECGYGEFTYFADNATLDICFTGSGSTTERDLVRTAIRDTWDAYTGLIMRWRGSCPDDVNAAGYENWVSIYLNTQATGNGMEGTGAAGLGNRLSVDDCNEWSRIFSDARKLGSCHHD